MRAQNMTMSNAQAALIAAANSSVRGSAVPVEPILKRAAAYLSWLDSQDTRVALVSFDKPVTVSKPEPIVQCTATSKHGIRCLLAQGHSDGDIRHRNSIEGVHWDDRVALPVHFLASPGARAAVCGVSTGVTERGYRRLTTSVSDTTCDACKEELGL